MVFMRVIVCFPVDGMRESGGRDFGSAAIVVDELDGVQCVVRVVTKSPQGNSRRPSSLMKRHALRSPGKGRPCRGRE